MNAKTIVNALTIDVEDYFQVSAFAPYIRRDEWDERECRVERNVNRILDLLGERKTVGRLVRAEEDALFAAYLCSPAASYVNGQALAVDGGMNTLRVRAQ